MKIKAESFTNEFCKSVGIILEGNFLFTYTSKEGIEYTLGSSDNYDLITGYSAFINKKEDSLDIQAYADSELLLYLLQRVLLKHTETVSHIKKKIVI